MVSSADILHGKILIVDDQEANVLLLEQMLKNAGYDQVTSTRDPTQVCELHLLHKYDLILLDLQMPGMDGFQVMENLKELEQGSYLPVLVITAQPEHKLRALKAGARDFVSKPFDLGEVLVRARNLLEVRLLHRETKQLYEQVLAEQKVSTRLMLEVLPALVVERLKRRDPEVVSGTYAEVTLIFADLLEFNRFSEGAGAMVLAGVLDDLSIKLDAGSERVGIIDDAWLATAGLSDAVAAQTIRAAQKAVDLKASLDRFNAVSNYKLQIRIGLDTGPSVAQVSTKRQKKEKKGRPARARH